MSEIRFDLKPVTEKPSRKYRKASKYNPILLAFVEGTDNLAMVEAEGKDANYIRIQLNKRIKAHGLKGVKISVINNACYLEKV